MTEFQGEREKTIRLRRPLAEVFAAFTDTDLRGSCIVGLERKDQVDSNTVRWVLKEESQRGLRIKPDYTVRYEDNGEDSFSWSTLKGNPRSKGGGVCRRISENETEVEYRESIVLELPVPRLLGAVIKGIVGEQIASGVDKYLDDIRSKIESGTT